MTYYTFIDTPAGALLLIGDGQILHGMHWQVFKRVPAVQPDWIENRTVFNEVITQLDEYFTGQRQTFDFDFAAHGTAFQQRVWQELRKIPFGGHSTYKSIAEAIGNPKAVRAVGTAVGSNPISIVIPCHRVLTTGKKLGGYAGGLLGKEVLLKNEGIAWGLPATSLQT